ncbi:response regulator [Paenibacillus sp. sgz302251]|uniref:response regulator n=1 Tax=Paenibacillus sp. sgz302251 TaxID=3414493 RepID=UPI003C7AE0F5
MKRILVADDEDILRLLIVDTLEDMGYEIHEAADGKEAYSVFETGNFDLLIADYMMPEMTGIELIKEVREHPLKGTVKIIMLTAKSQQEDEAAAMAAGADYFIMKPFSPLKLAEIVEEILND